eukprot:CAMPEP_0183753424 /NCGR_PEP_ID=MMETSP0739-20130205/2932_1 /TAXON_ID=385413 /ORGANISM="Thalassiosira miniscula, Strain CCMP1093" /LENGTH=129 /DNA_ID=CAMNT_0025989907 /DNA_START=126 /DNA_END=515 /DNA_ORIENTATION=+
MTTIKALLAITLILAPISVLGREAMLGDDKEGHKQRRLGFFFKSQEYYESIYYRCCGGEGATDEESLENDYWRRSDAPPQYSNQYCKCPKRGSSDTPWFGWSTQTYLEKWEASCADGGKIAKKAGKSPY